MSQNLDRRVFLKSSFAFGAATALGLVGCASGETADDASIVENADVFGFTLSADEMAAIDTLDRNQRFASY